jgi:ferredoxin
MIDVIISKDCQSWGQCVFDAPGVFDLIDGERKTWNYYLEDSLENKITVAASHCPNSAISFKKV